jgi:hypothetical protein
MSHPPLPVNWTDPTTYNRQCNKAVSDENLFGNFGEKFKNVAHFPPWIPDSPTFVIGGAKEGVYLMAQHFPRPGNHQDATKGVYINMLDLHLKLNLHQLANNAYGRYLMLVEPRVVFWFSRSE